MLNDWSALLAGIQRYAPEAHIAGGAVRDLHLGRTIKDLDIFVYAQSMGNFGAEIEKVITTTRPRTGQSCRLDYVGADLTAISSTEFLSLDDDGPLPVNLIVLADGVSKFDNVNRIDFGICRCFFDGDTLFYAPAFLKDEADRTFTLLRCNSPQQFERSMRRFVRLQPKYVGWTLVVPPEFDSYAAPKVVSPFFPIEAL